MASQRTQDTCSLCCDAPRPCHQCLLTALGALLLLQGVITGVWTHTRVQGAQLAKPDVCIGANRKLRRRSCDEQAYDDAGERYFKLAYEMLFRVTAR